MSIALPLTLSTRKKPVVAVILRRKLSFAFSLVFMVNIVDIPDIEFL